MAVAAPPQNMTKQQQAAAQAAQAELARQANNRAYLAKATPKFAVCPPSAGAGVNQNYAVGSTLIYDVPSAQGAFLEEIWLVVSVIVNNAAGTAAVYALTAGAPYTLFDHVEVIYNGTQAYLRPIFTKYIEQLYGYGRNQPFQVMAGESVTNTTNTVWGTFGVATGNNTWNFYLPIRLRHIPWRPAGMLPVMGDATKCQIKLYCSNTLQGGTDTANAADPLISVESAVSGTGHAVTISAGSTVQVLAVYRDGTNLISPQPLSLNLANEPTVQYYKDRDLNPLSANLMMRQKIDTHLQHWFLLSIIVDGNQSGKFAADSNISGIEFDQDSVGQNRFFAFGTTGSNVPFLAYRALIRKQIGQDLDEGVIPWIVDASFAGVNASNREGQYWLNMLGGGWTDTNIAAQVASVTTTNFTPRVETYLVALNPAGLVRS